MGKTKKRNKKGGGIGNSKPEKSEKPHTPLEKTRKNVNFSPTTKPPSSPKQNKTKKMFISRNRERQKAVTKYENRQEKIDLMDMVLGKMPLKGGKKKRTRRRKKGGNEEECPICMEHLNDDEKITTECNHDFHRECFIQNCLTELSKGNFKQRDRENKVFQCPNCRGDTKANCLNDPEVRAIYEGLQVNRDNNHGLNFDSVEESEFYHMIVILGDKLENTIQQSENGIISDMDKLRDIFWELGIIGDNFEDVKRYLTLEDSDYITITAFSGGLSSMQKQSNESSVQHGYDYKLIAGKDDNGYKIYAAYPE